MEIDFNASRISQAASSQPSPKRVAAGVTTATASFSTSESLKSRIDNLPTVRAEQVAKAKELVADPAYPPDYLLRRIANLLAINLDATPSDQIGQSSSSVEN